MPVTFIFWLFFKNYLLTGKKIINKICLVHFIHATLNLKTAFGFIILVKKILYKVVNKSMTSKSKILWNRKHTHTQEKTNNNKKG